LADLLTPLLDTNPFSTVRASFRWQLSNERNDGVADGRQAWLRRRSIDSFFNGKTLNDRESCPQCRADKTTGTPD
jgi:hypothetical protein